MFEVTHELNPEKTNLWWLAGLGPLLPVMVILYTLSGIELEEIQSLRILGIPLDFELAFEIHLREVVPKAARSLVVVVSRKVTDFPRVLKTSFNERVLFILGALCRRVDVIGGVSFGFTG